jgi:hypothetical protein
MCFGVLPFAVGRNPANLGPPVTDFLTVRTDRYQFQPSHRPARSPVRPSVRPSPHTVHPGRRWRELSSPLPETSTWFFSPFSFHCPKSLLHKLLLPISFWLPASFWARRKDKTRQGMKWKEIFRKRDIYKGKKTPPPTSLFPLVLKRSGFSSPSCELALCHLVREQIHIGWVGGGKKVDVVWVWVLMTLPNLYVYKAYPLLERW